MTFATPWLLWIAAAAPLAVAALQLHDRARRRALVGRLGELPVVGKVIATATTRSRPWSSTWRVPAICGRAAASAISAAAAPASASLAIRRPGDALAITLPTTGSSPSRPTSVRRRARS